jgi:hypothetical protein
MTTKERRLIAAYDAYIKGRTEELHEIASLLFVHGGRSRRYNWGVRTRRRIWRAKEALK